MKNKKGTTQLLQVAVDENQHDIEEFIAKFKNSTDGCQEGEKKCSERRQNDRRDVDISGIMNLSLDSNETMFLPVQITNISSKGMLLTLNSKGYIFMNMLSNIEKITVSFLDNSNDLQTINCLPKHVQLQEAVELGVELVSNYSSNKEH